MNFVLKKFVVVPFLLSATVLSADYVGTYITEKPSISLEGPFPLQSKPLGLKQRILTSSSCIL